MTFIAAPMHLRSLFFFLVTLQAALAQEAAPKGPSPWGDFVEKDFPFFSSVLDCRDVGEGFPKDNLTPRGLILNLGHNLWACFDTDLLRIACIWEGEPGKPPVTPTALAPGSYHVAGQKTKDGQDDLPKPIGKVWLANGIYPGWQVGDRPTYVDEREPAPSADEVGRGGIIESRVLSLEFKDQWIETKLEVEGIKITQRVLYRSGPIFEYDVGPHREPMVMTIGHPGKVTETKTNLKDNQFEAMLLGKGDVPERALLLDLSDLGSDIITLRRDENGVLFAHIPPSQKGQTFQITSAGNMKVIDDKDVAEMPKTFWPQTLTTKATLSQKPDAYVIDDIPLPVPNPWKRNVRLADLAFLNDQGDAAGVTFDGDVWLISGLKGDLEAVTWKRFASGLHEPMSIVSRNGEVLVFDRNGIWKLVDSNGDKECDRYEMFCNLFAQTAETREFPNSMKLGPKGELYISKGGQEGTTRGKHNGTVIKVAADGKSFEVIGYGLRQPFIGVNAQTGFVTASDQQGHYVPSTPLHLIRDHQFYGHLPTIAEKEKYPETIAEPLTWLPHPVNPSGVTQTWLLGSKMGPVDGDLIHIGYNRPELFVVLQNTHFAKPQAAVVSFSREFDFPTLNAIVNPADGQLYVTGFQVWGTVVKRLSGLARVRWTGKPRVLLEEVTPTDKG
ncbi:MAG: hypothetical protein RLZZ476_736, partial [Verrucomicrobiota bacterium]